MKISDQIMEKVKRIETDKSNLKRCLLARVCPKCGEKSITCVNGKSYTCNKCNSTYSC